MEKASSDIPEPAEAAITERKSPCSKPKGDAGMTVLRNCKAVKLLPFSALVNGKLMPPKMQGIPSACLIVPGYDRVHQLVPMLTPFTCPRTLPAVQFGTQPVPSDIAAWLLRFWSLPLAVQNKSDCITFASDLYAHHHYRGHLRVVDRTPDVSMAEMDWKAFRGGAFTFGVELLEAIELPGHRGVRVCHAAVNVGNELYISKLGCMAGYPLLKLEEMMHCYPEATRLRLVYLTSRCFGCNDISKATTMCLGGCKRVQYCSAECRIKHLPQHTPSCVPEPSTAQRAAALFKSLAAIPKYH